MKFPEILKRREFSVVALEDAADSELYLKDLGATHVLVNLEEGFVFGYLKVMPDGTVVGSVMSHVGIEHVYSNIAAAAQGTYEAAERYLDGIS